MLISSRSILRMMVEKRELPWANIRFESKIESNQAFDLWC